MWLTFVIQCTSLLWGWGLAVGLSHWKACAYPIPLLALPLVMGSKEEGELGVEPGSGFVNQAFRSFVCALVLQGCWVLSLWPAPPFQSPSCSVRAHWPVGGMSHFPEHQGKHIAIWGFCRLRSGTCLQSLVKWP